MHMLGILFTVCTLQQPVTETKVVYKVLCPAAKECYKAACKTKCTTVGNSNNVKRKCVQTCKCFCKEGKK